MTATNRGGERREADFYPTPERSTIQFLRVWQPPFTGEWLEPCAGDGAIIRAAANFYQNPLLPKWTAVELMTDRPVQLPLIAPPVEWHQPQDFLTWETQKKFSVCMTNPPFNLAMPIILKSMSLAHCVAMLLRLDYLGTQKRNAFHKEHPSNVYVLSDRPFPDACEYAWFVWPGENKWCVLDP